MSSRTVRLDKRSEKLLAEIVRAKRLTVSAALKQGLVALHEALKTEGLSTTPYTVYRALDLGRGGHARVGARRSKAEIRRVLRERARR
jgi:hypothetical protein